MAQEAALEIREIEADENETCALIYVNAWNGALPEVKRQISVADFEGETQGERIFVAVVDGKIAAYISIWEPDWFIHHLYVDPCAQRVGLGKALVSHSTGLAGQQALSLKCQLDNLGAMAFYKALGFEISGATGADDFGSWVRLVKPSNIQNYS